MSSTEAHVNRQPDIEAGARLSRANGTLPVTVRPDGQRRIRILGHEMDAITGAQVLDWVQFAARGRRRTIVGSHNFHSLYLVARHPAMARFYEMADIIQIDSMALVRFGRMIGQDVSPRHRSTYLDWRDEFWANAHRFGLRIFYLGGEPGLASGAVRMMEMAYPGIRFGGRDGFFDPTRDGEENLGVLSDIRRFAPDILLVGMGMPRQEIWIAENCHDLPPCVIMPVGSALDDEVGARKVAPRWMGEWGIEWLYHLGSDPKRLASRYLYEPWFLLKPALRDIFRRR